MSDGTVRLLIKSAQQQKATDWEPGAAERTIVELGEALLTARKRIAELEHDLEWHREQDRKAAARDAFPGGANGAGGAGQL